MYMFEAPNLPKGYAVKTKKSKLTHRDQNWLIFQFYEKVTDNLHMGSLFLFIHGIRESTSSLTSCTCEQSTALK